MRGISVAEGGGDDSETVLNEGEFEWERRGEEAELMEEDDELRGGGDAGYAGGERCREADEEAGSLSIEKERRR